MCPPTFYGIEYEINPWMNRARPADHSLAVEQWEGLRSQIIAAGTTIELLDPVPGMPDLVFTANAALVCQGRAILSRFRHPQRQLEEPINRAWFTSHGFDVVEPPAGFSFEGAGDALFCGDTLFAGYRMRSDAMGQQRIGELLDVRVLPMELIDSYYYHLDTCFCPLAPGEAIWYPPAFDEYGRRVIQQYVDRLVAVEKSEAEHFACNAVVVGRRVITNTGCEHLHEELVRSGYEPIATPLGEFVKAGGSAKCLTLRLDGEEALAETK
jgi:N-dimethylarginine dimethylaminohydrolase